MSGTQPPPAPHANPEFVGHDGPQQTLLGAFESGRLPHAWLITGPRGVGKATLAYRFARVVLGGGGGAGLFGSRPEGLQVPADDPVFRRIAADSHRDLMTLKRRPDEQGKMPSVIGVQEARRVTGFFHMTAAEGGWRVVVVDPVEEMNLNAANALLKALEEPPDNALILLISHAPGRLLPTIRSRCCHLPLAALSEAVVLSLLARHAPELAETDAVALARLSEGSIGRALDLAAGGGLELYRDLLEVIAEVPALDAEATHRFGERLARGSDGAAFRTGMELLIWWLARLVRAGSLGDLPPEVVAGEGALMTRLLERRPLAHWLALWEKISRLFASAERANLDRKQVVVTAFLELEATAS